MIARSMHICCVDFATDMIQYVEKIVEVERLVYVEQVREVEIVRHVTAPFETIVEKSVEQRVVLECGRADRFVPICVCACVYVCACQCSKQCLPCLLTI